jgi:hypothetical protein
MCFAELINVLIGTDFLEGVRSFPDHVMDFLIDLVAHPVAKPHRCAKGVPRELSGERIQVINVIIICSILYRT